MSCSRFQGQWQNREWSLERSHIPSSNHPLCYRASQFSVLSGLLVLSPSKHSWELAPMSFRSAQPGEGNASNSRYEPLFFPKNWMHRPEILDHFLKLALQAPYASITHPEHAQALPHGGPTRQTRKCNCTRTLLSRGHRPDDKEPGKEVSSWISLPKGKQAKEHKMSAEGMLPLIEWRRAPAGWKPRINNNNNKKISKACQLGRDIWLVIRGACESINPSPSWISTLKHASLHCCRGTCWMSCKDEWN